MHNIHKLNCNLILFITFLLLMLMLAFFWLPADALAQGEGESVEAEARWGAALGEFEAAKGEWGDWVERRL